MNSLTGKLLSGISRLTTFEKRVDDPLTSVRSATRWIESLPIGDAFKCQEAILGKLKHFNEKSTEYTKDRLAVLMLLDEKSRDLQDTLVGQYLRNPRMSRSLESRLWHTVYGLYWEVARGYHTFVLRFAQQAGKAQHENEIPLITLRAIRTFGQLLKWRAIRYLPAGERLWLRLHNLYRIAESENFQRRPLRAYAEDPLDCCCETAYLHIMMLNLASSGTLYPRQLDLLDRWLFRWHGVLQLDTRLDPAVHTFAVDLSADHGARRARKPETGKPIRYWSTAEVLLKVNEAHTAIRGGTAPAQLGLTEDARTAESLELLEHLRHHWGPLAARDQRRAPRETVKRLFDITHGLSAIVGQVKSAAAPAAVSPYGIGLNYNEADDVQVYGFITDRTRERVSHLHLPPTPASVDVERWVMHDESLCGYGAIAESRERDWLRVGALLGIKAHDDEAWKLGVIRRLARLNDDTTSVGIETIAEVPELVMMAEMAATSGYTVGGYDTDPGSLPRPGLWLAKTTEGGNDSVIIDPVHYAPGKIFQIQTGAEPKFIALGNPVERSEGWMRVIVQPTNA